MTLRRAALALLCALALAPARPAHADDSSKRWRTIETEHFHIVYYVYPDGSGEEAVAQRLAVVAEQGHALLVRYLGPGLSKRRKTWVVITDDTDDFNGSATVNPYPLVRLYATSPPDRAELNDYDDWLRGLFLHEYTHILHLGTIRGWCAPIINAILGWGLGISYAPNQAQPRFIIEGMAVYEESARSSGGRLRNSIWDMYLRAQTLEGRFQRMDQFSNSPIQFPDANAPYLYGSELIRYVAEKYGDDALLRYSLDYGAANPICIPFAINRSLRHALTLNSALEHVIGKTWTEVYADFKRDMQARYGAQRDAIAKRGITPARVLLPSWRSLSRPAVTPDGRAALVWDDDGYHRVKLRRVDLATGKKHTELSDPRFIAAGGPSLSADGRWLAFHAAQIWNTFYYYNDVYLFDRSTGKVERLTNGLRATNPALSPDGRLVAMEVNRATARGLGLYDRQSRKLDMLIPARGFEQVYTPTFSPDGKTLAFSWWHEGGFRDIWLMDLASRKLTRVTADRALDLEPRFSADGRWLYFTSDRTKVYNLYAYELSTKKLYQATNVVDGVFDPAVSPDGKKVAFVGFHAEGYDFEVAPLDRQAWWEAAPPAIQRPLSTPPVVVKPLPSHRYNPFPTALPWTFTPTAAPDGYGELLGFNLSGADAIGHHFWGLSLKFGTGRADDINFSANYTYAGLWPSLHLGIGHALLHKGGLVIDGVDRGYDEDDWTFGASVSLPILTRLVGSSSLTLSYNLTYARNLTAIPPPDPSALIPVLPQVGRTAGVAVSWNYSSAERFRYSISAERGRDLGIYLGVGSRYLGSSFETYVLTWRWSEYIPMPWPAPLRSHVLALTYSGGISGGDRHSLFFLGGYPPQNLLQSIYDFSRPGSASLRGYPYASVVGDQFHVLNAEYRFPIAWIEHGPYKTFPLYLRRLHGVVFADYGGAFNGGFSFDKLKLGVGGELILELTYAYYFDAALQLGYARGVDKGGGNQIYFLLNSPF